MIKKILDKINLFKIFKYNLIFNFSKKISGLPLANKGLDFIISFSKSNYISYFIRPKYSKNFKQISTEEVDFKEFGIIIQGPISNKKELNFLKETLQIYKLIFPKTLVVISTWENSYIDDLETDEYIKIKKSKLPDKPGLANINYQIKSTSNAIQILKKEGIKNILKTRTDCRIMKPNLKSYFLSLQKTFISENTKHSRIFASNVATCKYRIYGLTDILLFGSTHEIETYFKDETEDEILKNYSFEKVINETAVMSEILLCARYLKNKGIKLDWTLEHWWHCLSKYFGIVDVNSIDFFWYKYDWNFEQRFIRNYLFKSSRSIEFSEWLSMYNEFNLNFKTLNYKEKFKYDEKKNTIIKKTFL